MGADGTTQAERPAHAVAGGIAARAPGPDLTIVVPTFNEAGNINELVSRLADVLGDEHWEVIFVDDDSQDGTIDVLRAASRANARIRLIHRIGRRGLASAVVEGMQASSAPVIAVMDADLQHDERILPEMLRRIRSDGLDVVIGSRHAEGGSLGEWSKDRVRISGLATRASRLLMKTPVGDPMSGFFMMRRETLDACIRRLSSQGFKILLDILASSPTPLKIGEVGYTFRTRTHGESKLDSAVAWDYLALLLDKLVGRYIPVRFVMFAAVGGAGLVLHMIVLGLGTNAFGAPFLWAQTGATIAAMTFNFFVNNVLTYRDRRLKGWNMLKGLLLFYLTCSVGAIANVGIANFMFAEAYSWWLSGIAGVLVGAVWNYAISSVFTWRKV